MIALTGCASPNQPFPPERPTTALIRNEKPGAARIDGVGPIQGFAAGRDCTFVHCLELVLNALGRKIDYDELMGASGTAFRLQWRVDRWDVGNPDPLVGASCLADLFKVAGWDYRLHVVRREQVTDAEGLRRAIADSINAGIPVLAANVIPPEDWGIITGYERHGWNWLCRAYHGDAEAVDRPATGWPTAVVMLTNRRDRTAPRELHAESIRKAIKLFEQRSHEAWAVGDNAFEHWCQMLASPANFRYVHPNIWTYIGLIDARAAGARYLRSIADEFGDRKTHVLEAAAAYEQEVDVLINGLGSVPSERQYPDSMPPAEMRYRQIETLQRARELEKRAIGALKRAL